MYCLGLIATSIFLIHAHSAQAQDDEVPTFTGERGKPIRILNEKGEVQEELDEAELKSIKAAPPRKFPQLDESESTKKKSMPTVTRGAPSAAKKNKTIDELLKQRRQNRNIRRASGNQPPRKRR